jgi:hypothetical protein
MNTEIKGNNWGYIFPEGCELALIKNGKIVAQGDNVKQQSWDACAATYLQYINRIIDHCVAATPQVDRPCGPWKTEAPRCPPPKDSKE